jgi:hypothetical protein
MSEKSKANITEDKPVKFMHFATNGWVVLFDNNNADKSKELLDRLKERAAGNQERHMAPDTNLARIEKTEDFLKMIASGDILLRSRSNEKGAIDLAFVYGICHAEFSYEKMFISPPVIEVKYENNILLVNVDYRLELKKMFRQDSDIDILRKALTDGDVREIPWRYLASKNVDFAGYSCNVFSQKPDAYRVRLLASKKDF